MLRINGRAWTWSRILSAGATLAEVSAGPASEAERRIHRVPGLEGVTVETPCLATPDPLQWDLHRTATALVARSRAALGRGTSPADSRDQIRRVQAALQRELTEALADFVSGMDAEVLQVACSDGVLDLALYNYLARVPSRAFRLQFALTFPSLVRIAAVGSPGTLGAELRPIVEDGRRVVKSLASRWGVRPGVIRHLVGRPLELSGGDWVTRPRELALLLNALRPDDVPADRAEDWERFNEAAGIGQKLFRKPVWQSAAALQWLRECVYRARRGSQVTRMRWLPDHAALGEIDRFRDALAESLCRDAPGLTVALAQSLSLACEEVVDRFFSRSARGGLGSIAADYQEVLADLRRQLREGRAQASRVAAGDEMWPLIPTDFVTSDRTRVVRPLTDHEQLSGHGAALGNCLGRGYAFRYLRQGSHGTRFVVGLFDARTGTPCSTAEVVIKRYSETHSYGLTIAQHTAKENAEPSPACTQAMDKLLRRCGEPDMRRHLEQGWLLLATRKSRPSRPHDAGENLATVRMALRRCLGGRTYDGLLAELLQARLNTSSADPAPH